MKRIQKINAAAMAMMLPAAMLLAACSSEDNLTEPNTVAVGDAQISITIEPFETTKKNPKSRAATDETKPDTVIFENGLRAVVSVEEDEPEANTRAAIADGHYTIYACDATTGARITGTGKLLKGTFSGGVFTRDAGTALRLAPGTYKFVCINDAVTDRGTYLEVNSIPTSVTQNCNAQIGTTTETISGTDWQVKFIMRHQNARVRFHVVAYSDHMGNLSGDFKGGNWQQPYYQKYSIDGTTITGHSETDSYNRLLSYFTMPTTSTTYNATYVQAHDFYGSYVYLTPGVNLNACIWNVGQVYGKAITNFTSKLTNLVRNHSYTITYRILPDALYLFQDGTAGAISEKGSRTPIGVIVSEKTNTKEGMAVALKSVIDEFGGSGIVYGTWGPRMFVANNTSNFSDYTDGMQDMDGYKWTHDPAGSTDGTVKADNENDYTVFYYAAHYNPGVSVTGTNVGKWYLPALGEWKQMIMTLANWDGVLTFVGNGGSGDLAAANVNRMNKAFTDAGGTTLFDTSLTTRHYWSSSEVGSIYNPLLSYNPTNNKIVCSPEGYRHNNYAEVRPFVHF